MAGERVEVDRGHVRAAYVCRRGDWGFTVSVLTKERVNRMERWGWRGTRVKGVALILPGSPLRDNNAVR